MSTRDTDTLARELAAAKRRVTALEAELGVRLQDDVARLRGSVKTTGEPESRRRECTHKTPSDHIMGYTKQERAVWRCTKCGAQDTWKEGWMYYGTIECKRCWLPEMDYVHCPACSQKRVAQDTPAQGTPE